MSKGASTLALHLEPPAGSTAQFPAAARAKRDKNASADYIPNSSLSRFPGTEEMKGRHLFSACPDSIHLPCSRAGGIRSRTSNRTVAVWLLESRQSVQTGSAPDQTSHSPALQRTSIPGG